MKAVIVLLASMFLASTSLASEGVEVSQASETLAAPAASIPSWNLNLGMSRIQSETSQQSLTFEVQRKIGSAVYLGLSYGSHAREFKSDGYVETVNTDIGTASIELRPIRIQIKEFELFSAVNGGVLAYLEARAEAPGQSFFYGAGVGVNYNNSVGLRADMKSSRTFPTITALSLIGYY